MRTFYSILISALVGAAQTPHQPHHPPQADEYARILEDPSRDVWQRPEEVVQALELNRSQTIADIGAGSGYFARRIAPHVAMVYAVDIDPKLLAIARTRSPANVKSILAAPDDPKLPRGSIDTVFICDVLHHIGNRPAYYARLAEALKPHGRIVVVDFYKKELPVGPPPAMKLSDDEVISEFRKAGFGLNKRIDTLPYQYFLFFDRR
ncbi:MAG TPA: class I SAM-dependent methyltransferase [Bryobacteraceae bacterium]|nr:class I SAM-dependent methyltransferase [Bryobacteraceae bacterium]